MTPKRPTAARLAVLILACMGLEGLMAGGFKRRRAKQAYFSMSDGSDHYQLQIDKLEFDISP